MPVSNNEFAEWVNLDALKSRCPPGYSVWWIRGKVLHTEIIERPIEILTKNGPTRSEIRVDTLVSVQDMDTSQARGYEIRLSGRVSDYAPGDRIELFGHNTAKDQSYLPRIAGSIDTGLWRYALKPLRSGDYFFVIRFITPSLAQFLRGKTRLTDEDYFGMEWLKVSISRMAWLNMPVPWMEKIKPNSSFPIKLLALLACWPMLFIFWVGLGPGYLGSPFGIGSALVLLWLSVKSVKFDFEPVYKMLFSIILSQRASLSPASDSREPVAMVTDDHNLPPT